MNIHFIFSLRIFVLLKSKSTFYIWMQYSGGLFFSLAVDCENASSIGVSPVSLIVAENYENYTSFKLCMDLVWSSHMFLFFLFIINNTRVCGA